MNLLSIKRIILAVLFSSAALVSFAEGEQEAVPGPGRGFNRDMDTSAELRSEPGLLIGQVVQDSPAERAGLVRGDILLSLEGKTLRRFSDIRDILKDKKGGDDVIFEVIHGSETKDVTVTLEERLYRPPIGVIFAHTGAGEYHGYNNGPTCGGPLDTMHQMFRDHFPLPPVRRFFENIPDDLDAEKLKGGVVITSVLPDTPAEKAGLKDGDFIHMIDGVDLTPEEGLKENISGHSSGDEVVISVIRDGKEMDIPVVLDETESGDLLLGITYRMLPFIFHKEFEPEQAFPGRGVLMFRFGGSETESSPRLIPDKRGEDKRFPGGRDSESLGGV